MKTGYFENGVFVERDMTPEELAALPRTDKRAALKAAVTAKRWEVETGGITLPSGVRVGTKASDKARITETLAGMPDAGITEIDFQAESGWVTLTFEELTAIRVMIALHVQHCFSMARAHHEAIDALPEADLDTYDIEQGWTA